MYLHYLQTLAASLSKLANKLFIVEQREDKKYFALCLITDHTRILEVGDLEDIEDVIIDNMHYYKNKNKEVK